MSGDPFFGMSSLIRALSLVAGMASRSRHCKVPHLSFSSDGLNTHERSSCRFVLHWVSIMEMHNSIVYSAFLSPNSPVEKRSFLPVMSGYSEIHVAREDKEFKTFFFFNFSKIGFWNTDSELWFPLKITQESLSLSLSL